MVKLSLVDCIVVFVRSVLYHGAESHDYFVPRGKQLNVMNGDHVSAGDALTVGDPVLHDMLRILGPMWFNGTWLIKFRKFTAYKARY